MASIASSSNSSSSSSTTHQESRPQAGPLPSKRGEIGYVEGQDDEERSTSPDTTLPARHPADRDTPATTSNSESSPTPVTANHSIASPSTSTLISTNNSTTKKRKRILNFLKPKKVPAFGGFLLTTLLAAICQILFIGGCIAGWVLATKRLSRDQNGGIGPSSAIFVHVLFGVTILGQLLFLERRIFRLRAERYTYLHPGQILPSHRNIGGSDPSIAFSPWNRPPLPTYAAALAQSGVGTGDVEDHLIAAPPPPAYGNTRGSTMLLAGYLRDSLRAQRPASERSQTSRLGERPLSYVSRDEQWEEIQDAERSRRLEETLARLERPGTRL